MKRERRKFVPVTPASMMELGPSLENFQLVHGIYRGSISSTDGGHGYIFIHPKMEEPLKHCQTLFADGTFKVS